MREIQLIKDFWADEPPPDPDQLPAIRAKVLAAMEGVRAPHRRASRAARMARASRRHALTGPRLAVGGVLAGALAVGVAAAVLIPSGASGPTADRTGSHPGKIQLDAAAVLHRAARAALSAPVPHKNQFIYAETLRRANGQPKQQIFEWLSVDGKRLSSARTIPCDFPQSPGCRMGILATGGVMFTYAGLQKLPTAPSALLGYLYREQTQNCPTGLLRQMSRPGVEWSGIYTVLGDVPLLPPRFGAALFNAAAQIPGVEVIRNVTTAAGQRGIAVARTVRAKPWRGGALAIEKAGFIFNPHTYQYLGTIEKGNETAHLLTSNALLKTKFVNSAPPVSFRYGFGVPACIGL
jgi:hypothetical protein